MDSLRSHAPLEAAARLVGFQPLPGAHCETTMLRNMFHHAGATISEPMLFGLGQGIDFRLWESPDPGRSAPMLTGRIEPGEVARNACGALGVDLVESCPADPDSAYLQSVRLLAAGHVVGVTVDIYHLDYFSTRSHFSAHCVALYALGETVACLVDTEQQGGTQELPTTSLRKARASDEGFMPSPNRQMHLGILPARVVTDLDSLLMEHVWAAIHATATRMLSDSGTSTGIRGLRQAGREVLALPHSLASQPGLVAGIGRFWRFGGTGGTNFRGLFLDFLREVRQRSGETAFDSVIAVFDEIRQGWDHAIELLLAYGEAEDREAQLNEISSQIHAIAGTEQEAFRVLRDIAGPRVGKPA